MALTAVLSQQSITSSTAVDSAIFHLQPVTPRLPQISVCVSVVDASASSGSNDVTLRLYYSPNYTLVADKDDAHWIEAPIELYEPMVVTEAEDYAGTHGDTTSFFAVRSMPGHLGQCKLVAQRLGAGDWEAEVSAWVEV